MTIICSYELQYLQQIFYDFFMSVCPLVVEVVNRNNKLMKLSGLLRDTIDIKGYPIMVLLGERVIF